MYLYTIFYNECKPVSIDILKEYMYSFKPIKETVITECIPTNIIEKEIVSPKVDILHKIENQCLKASHVQDGLFWSIFIAHYGYNEYLRNKYNYGKLEVNEKQNITDYVLSKGSSALKTNYKLTRSMCAEMISDLTSLPRMVNSGLIAMCSYYKSDIYIIDIEKHTYLFFACLEEGKKEVIVLYKNPLHTPKFSSNAFFIDIGITIQSLEEIRENYFCIEHYSKPLKGISTYLKPDLEIIAEKTVFREKKSEKIYSKQELYNNILMYISPDEQIK